MRIGGIASGMDTEQMVRDLMRAERVRVDKYFQQEQRLKWRQDAYTNINRSMANFILNSRKTFGLTTTTSTGTLLSNSVDSFNWVKKATSSNEGGVKATANTNAMTGTYKVQVEQLAEVATIASESLEGKLDENLKFKEDATFKVTTKEGSQDIQITAGMSVNDLVKQLNNAKAGASDKSLGIKASYDAGLNKMLISTKETGASNFITVEDVIGNFAEEIFKLGNGSIQSSQAIDIIPETGDFILKINDGTGEKSISVTANEGETLKEFADRINESEDLKGYVKASANNGKLTIMAINDATVEIEGNSYTTNTLKLKGGPIDRSITGGAVKGQYLETGSFTIDVAGEDYTIAVEKNWTLGDLAEAINTNEDLNGAVKASITTDGKLVLTKGTGETVEISGSYVANNLNITEGIIEDFITSTDTIETNYVAAGAFQVNIDGTIIDIEIAENTTFDELVAEINDKISGTGVIVSGTTDNRLTFNVDGDKRVTLGGDDEYLRNTLGLDIGPIVGISEGDIINEIKETNDDFVIKIDGQDKNINFNGGSLDDLAAAITEQTGGKVTATNVNGKLQLELTGASEAEVLGTPYVSELGLPTNEKMTSQTGKDAIITFNGDTIEKSTNNFTVFGINLQLQSEHVEGAEPITIRVGADVDSIYDKVKEFVDSYNKIIDEVNGQTNQKYYRDFPPLTNEQKEAMSEKDIEVWEEKAKSGLLKGDSTLTRTLQSIRSGLYETVDNVAGSYNHITQLGITTGTYQEGGKLVIDEKKLKDAINNDPDGVVDLLFKSPASNLEGKEKLKDSGLVQRIYDGMIDGMKDVIRQSGPGEDATLLRNVRSNILIDFVTKQSSISVLGKDLSSINSRIFREEEMLARKEDRYWAQFTAMEKALSKMQSQGDWLMSQLGMGQ